MALNNAQKQAALRFRKAVNGERELRGVWLKSNEVKIVRREINKIVKKLRSQENDHE